MAQSQDQQQMPYDIAPRVWRDEQPGDEPRLVVSITFTPRDRSQGWREVRLATVEVRANAQRWTPRESSLSSSADGGFEVKASGAATLPAGAVATIALSLQTATGQRLVELSTEIQRVT